MEYNTLYQRHHHSSVSFNRWKKKAIQYSFIEFTWWEGIEQLQRRNLEITRHRGRISWWVRVLESCRDSCDCCRRPWRSQLACRGFDGTRNFHTVCDSAGVSLTRKDPLATAARVRSPSSLGWCEEDIPTRTGLVWSLPAALSSYIILRDLPSFNRE